MRRIHLAELIEARLDQRHVVICGAGSTMFAWQEIGATAPTYYAADAMGLAPGLALGFALASPDREVLLLEGDGDLIMNMGVLLTIVDAAPANLRIIVFKNDRYETGGGQAIPGSAALRLGAMAEAAGWLWAKEPDVDASPAEVGSAVDDVLKAPAPCLLVVGVDAEPAVYPPPGGPSGVEQRVEFHRQLQPSTSHEATEG